MMKWILLLFLLGGQAHAANTYRILPSDVHKGLKYWILGNNNKKQYSKYDMYMTVNNQRIFLMGIVDNIDCYTRIQQRFNGMLKIAVARGYALNVPKSLSGNCQQDIDSFKHDFLTGFEEQNYQDVAFRSDKVKQLEQKVRDLEALISRAKMCEVELNQCDQTVTELYNRDHSIPINDIVNEIKIQYGVRWFEKNIGFPLPNQ